jgi:K+-sensing histidine kinase KdpD
LANQVVWIAAPPGPARDRAVRTALDLGLDVAPESGSAPEGAFVLVHESVDARPLVASAPVLFGDSTPDERLRAALAAANDRVGLLSLFVHDLNNPLGAARMVCDLMRDDATPEQLRDIEDLSRALDLAIAHVETLGAQLRLEAGELSLTHVPADLCALVREVMARPAWRGAVLDESGGPVGVTVDIRAIQQALVDLLWTASRLAGDPAAVKVEVAGRSVRIRAPGVAVPRDLLPGLTRPYGALPIRERRVPVEPAGLAYAARVAEAHGGRLVVTPTDEGFDATLHLG